MLLFFSNFDGTGSYGKGKNRKRKWKKRNKNGTEKDLSQVRNDRGKCCCSFLILMELIFMIKEKTGKGNEKKSERKVYVRLKMIQVNGAVLFVVQVDTSFMSKEINQKRK